MEAFVNAYTFGVFGLSASRESMTPTGSA